MSSFTFIKKVDILLFIETDTTNRTEFGFPLDFFINYKTIINF